jgi:hypothetical protein
MSYRIDFSKGFSQWWHLSHTDFHVPSEHTQEGKRYAGEIQMYHWYSVSAAVAGIHNEVSRGVELSRPSLSSTGFVNLELLTALDL